LFLKKNEAMKTLTFILIAFFVLSGFTSTAQNLNNLSEQKPFAITGSLQIRSMLYNASGIDNRREPFSYIISGSPIVSIYSLQIPVSFLFSKQERYFRQPFNQFGFSPTYKWLKVHAGYRNISFSPYTLAGHTMLGAGVEMTPGIFRFGFMYGRLNRATAVDTLSGSVQPFQYTRHGYAMKMGVGNDSRHFDLSLVKAKDDSLSSSADIISRTLVTPAENLVVGVSSRVAFLKNFLWEGEGAVSLYTQNINSRLHLDSLSDFPDLLTNIVGRITEINGSSEIYSAFHTAVGYKNRLFSLRLQYKRIDPRYQSMGAYFFNNDVENITINPSFFMLNRRLRFSGSMGLQRDNLHNQKQATATRIIAAANLSADITQEFGVDFNFTNFSNSQRSNTILLADTFLLAQTTQNFSITPRYIIASAASNHIIMLSYNNMVLTDRNATTADFNNITSNNIFLNYQINLMEQNLSLSLNLNSTKLNMAMGLNGNEGITAGIQKRSKDQKWMAGYNSSFLQATTNNMKSIVLNNGIRIELQPANTHRFNIILNHIGNFPMQNDLEHSYPRFNEWRGEIGYNFNF
jgi:hypothetical protein